MEGEAHFIYTHLTDTHAVAKLKEGECYKNAMGRVNAARNFKMGQCYKSATRNVSVIRELQGRQVLRECYIVFSAVRKVSAQRVLQGRILLRMCYKKGDCNWSSKGM